ncbi:MAG: rhodanese-like domain-containing protein [Planctomycetes bacterium]|nr:rhodanese-like domain-containing protein [Planctomycetota bacterium]
MLRWILIAALAACAGPDPVEVRWLEIKARIEREFPAVDEWSTEQVEAALSVEPKPLLVDVRELDEFQISRIPGAVHVDPDEDLAVVPRDRTVIVYCSVGYRSAVVAERLREAGYDSVHNYLGSIFEWANRGLPLVDDDGPTDRVHPYDDHWGELLNARYH